MNPDNVAELIKKGFHVTLGATTSVVEALQDSQKREENLTQLNLGFDQLSQIWADKGQITETEARKLVDNLASQYGLPTNPMANGPATVVPKPLVDPLLIDELRSLTNELASIRHELTQLGQQES
ncbi:MAG: hypothetical protein HC934_03325 [Acaryochloridaceae cyanobacterium SU_2_1]|nr:hypothetical protein [Acaryochloridaceae cyanobacterium SU_2_1]